MDPYLYSDFYSQPSYFVPYSSYSTAYSKAPYWLPYSGRSTEAAAGLRREWWQTPTAAPLADLETKSGNRMEANRMEANVDWKETPEAHAFIADVPGLRREDVFVQVEGRMLSIWWDQKRDAVDTWRYTERPTGSFYRDIHLPADADEKETSMAVENGLLTVTVAKKKPVAKPVATTVPKQEEEKPVATTVPKQEEEKPVATTVPKQEEEKPVTSVLEQEEEKPIEGSDDEFDFVVV